MVYIRLKFSFLSSICFNLFLTASGQGAFLSALLLGESNLFNITSDGCNWKKSIECPDKNILMILYTSSDPRRRSVLDMSQNDWLINSGWDSQKQNIILIHGYNGGDEKLAIGILRDAYLNRGGYNVFLVDWEALSTASCYVTAIYNLRPVARCVAQYFRFLRLSGLSVAKTTCVGHSLGAHICGLLSNYLHFRIERIIGLDPAKPLITLSNRLHSSDAKSVQVLHTNAGKYGNEGKMGHVDFCVNGGRRQPYCEVTNNPDLCSHMSSVCYWAESIFNSSLLQAESCPLQCPPVAIIVRRSRNLFTNSIGNSIPFGQDAPMNAIGSYCVKDSMQPFCPSFSTIGDQRCCVNENTIFE